MTHVIEHSPSGRAKCRGCDTKIGKGELRFGERRPNAFGEGEMTLWFHVPCAAYKRPEPFLEMIDDQADDLAANDLTVARTLKPAAEFGIEHRRVPRLDTVDRAPTSRARCRSCQELIEKDTWRIGLVFFEEHRFGPSGFIHAACAEAYFGTTEVLERISHFNPALDAGDIHAIEAALQPQASLD
ncbi:MAG: hypothetical protein H0W33_07055 [Gammaproteobacteria bacterium]|nr:hypothetical protein [Gammaproteobacteria bacterium]